jgi:hypothetical protein
MKKKLLLVACLSGILSVSVFIAKAEISQKALQSFHLVFANAKHVKWTEYPDHYFVSFSQNDVLIKATYDKDGNLLNTLRYYTEQRLPLNVLYQVKNKYPQKSINIVTEVSDTEGTVYFIQLKDDKGWMTVKADQNADMEIIEKFITQK